MRASNRHIRGGVSLLETVLAASLLGGTVMTVCSLAAQSLRAVRLNQETEKAWDYIERQLVLIDIAGVDSVKKSGQKSGQFKSLDGRFWRWTVQIDDSAITALYDVTIGVEWEGPGSRLRRIECKTRLCGKGLAVDEAPTGQEPSSLQGVPQ
jgi:hypothetical protein